ncbi:TPA: hypothetical protein DDW35_00765 [Candidatus Sumerlaeota bacterium]|jgi:hypothetical protein|nr:hypothetical protein [Candidatus Sumerlaeota bacterium]
MKFLPIHYYAFGVITLFCFGVGGVPAEDSPESKNASSSGDVSFESKTDKNNYQWGEGISLFTEFTNQSDVMVFQKRFYEAYSVAVLDDSATSAPYSAHWWASVWGEEVRRQERERRYEIERQRARQHATATSTTFVDEPEAYIGGGHRPRLSKGEKYSMDFSVEHFLPIDRLFDLTMPGNYTATVQCKYGKRGKEGYATILTSATFSVTPPNNFECVLSTNTHQSTPLTVKAMNKSLAERAAIRAIKLDVCFANVQPTSGSVETTKTISQGEKVLKPSRDGRFYEIMVKGPRIEPVNLTRYGHSILDPSAKTAATTPQKIILPAGSETSHSIWLNRIFDMTVQGEYQVWAKCTATTADGKTEEYVSDKITISVQ